MSFKEKMAQVKALEDEISKMTDSLKDDLVAAVGDQPFQGKMINDGTNGGPMIGIVKFSQIMSANNWTPEYHFPAAQARAVSKKVKSCKTPTAVCKAVSEMIKEKRVRVKSGYLDGEVARLNNETLRILRESEIGQYVDENSQSAQADQ